MFAKIETGYYKNALSYPTKPKEPEVLRKLARDLSDVDIAALPVTRALYAEDMAEYRADLAAYRQEDARLEELFRVDLAHDHGMIDHPKEGLLYAKAYENGHSGGYSEIYNVYSDLVDLVR